MYHFKIYLLCCLFIVTASQLLPEDCPVYEKYGTKVWEPGQCQEIQQFVHIPLEECEKRCCDYGPCVSFNYFRFPFPNRRIHKFPFFGRCVLLKCPVPLPEPAGIIPEPGAGAFYRNGIPGITCPHKGVDLYGYDIVPPNRTYYPSSTGEPFKKNVATYQECGQLCEGHELCNYWTYYPYGTIRGGFCYLKISGAGIRQSVVPELLSGIKECN